MVFALMVVFFHYMYYNGVAIAFTSHIPLGVLNGKENASIRIL